MSAQDTTPVTVENKSVSAVINRRIPAATMPWFVFPRSFMELAASVGSHPSWAEQPSASSRSHALIRGRTRLVREQNTVRRWTSLHPTTATRNPRSPRQGVWCARAWAETPPPWRSQRWPSPRPCWRAVRNSPASATTSPTRQPERFRDGGFAPRGGVRRARGRDALLMRRALTDSVDPGFTDARAGEGRSLRPGSPKGCRIAVAAGAPWRTHRTTQWRRACAPTSHRSATASAPGPRPHNGAQGRTE
jgi:hypothetical protein